MMYKAQVAVCSEIRKKHSTQSENHEIFNKKLQDLLMTYIYIYNKCTGLFEIIVGVLTTCLTHTHTHTHTYIYIIIIINVQGYSKWLSGFQ